MRNPRLANFAWGVSLYLVGVILWGAYVRATGSGAGCGSNWPLCNGEIIPRAPALETLIEFSHRLSSGIGLVLVVVLFVWTFRSTPPRSRERLGASAALFFMLTEAMIGAGLVLFGLVAENDSMFRAGMMAFHLVNTYFLLAAVILTAWWAGGRPGIDWTRTPALSILLFASLASLLLLGSSGAVAALGDTLFPAASLEEALLADLSPSAHFLIRLRLYHPLIAIVSGLFILYALIVSVKNSQDPAAYGLARGVGGLYLAQLGLGALNVFLLAPVWLQLIHLFLSMVIWACMILFVFTVLATKSSKLPSTSHLMRGPELVTDPNR